MEAYLKEGMPEVLAAPEKELELILDGANIPQLTAADFELLGKCTMLQTLCMNEVGLKVFDAFPKLGIRELELERNGLDDNAKFEALVNCPNLRELRLSGNKISSIETLKPLASLRLLCLDLMLNPVTHDTEYRMKLFRLMPSLQVVDGLDRQLQPVDDDFLAELSKFEYQPEEEEEESEEEDEDDEYEDDSSEKERVHAALQQQQELLKNFLQKDYTLEEDDEDDDEDDEDYNPSDEEDEEDYELDDEVEELGDMDEVALLRADAAQDVKKLAPAGEGEEEEIQVDGWSSTSSPPPSKKRTAQEAASWDGQVPLADGRGEAGPPEKQRRIE